MAPPKLYILVGYPGSGKTTVAKLIHELTGAVHMWADQERRQMFGTPTWSEDESKTFYLHVNALVSQLLSEGKSVVFDTNFNYRRDRDLMRTLAGQFGAETVVIWLTTPKELAYQRATQAAEDQATRLYGNMSHQAFERIAGHLEPPAEDEAPIKLKGERVTADGVRQALAAT